MTHTTEPLTLQPPPAPARRDEFRTEHRGASAITATHRFGFDRSLGGVRFVERGSVEEVAHLAAGMSEKCAASRVPVDGQKTLVVCDAGVPADPNERAALLAEHVRAVGRSYDRGIFGPDMLCGSDVLDRLATSDGLSDHVTGLSPEHAGLDINRNAFTARGVIHALDCWDDARGPLRLGTAVVQGFGMVGAPVARGLARRGLVVKAVSNRHGTLVSDAGLDLALLYDLWRDLGDDCLAAYRRRRPGVASFDPDPNSLLDIDADLFVPAARTTVLALADELDDARAENPDARGVETFAERTNCRVILEAANHPLTGAAEGYLERHGVAILPDVLVNLGGMVGCYAEWRYRSLVRSGAVSLGELAERCHAYTAGVVEENVRRLAAHSQGARAAAGAIVAGNRTAMLARADGDIFGLER